MFRLCLADENHKISGVWHMPAVWADALPIRGQFGQAGIRQEAACAGKIHQFIPLIHATINIAVGSNILVAELFVHRIIFHFRICCTGHLGTEIQILRKPNLGSDLHDIVDLSVAGVGEGATRGQGASA